MGVPKTTLVVYTLKKGEIMLSAKKQTELYAALDKEVTDIRIKSKQQSINVEEELFYMQNRIWHRMDKILNGNSKSK